VPDGKKEGAGVAGVQRHLTIAANEVARPIRRAARKPGEEGRLARARLAREKKRATVRGRPASPPPNRQARAARRSADPHQRKSGRARPKTALGPFLLSRSRPESRHSSGPSRAGERSIAAPVPAIKWITPDAWSHRSSWTLDRLIATPQSRRKPRAGRWTYRRPVAVQSSGEFEVGRPPSVELLKRFLDPLWILQDQNARSKRRKSTHSPERLSDGAEPT
jgi:hypothetical protein